MIQTEVSTGGLPPRLGTLWPGLVSVLVFLLIVLCTRPWSELPLNDDWQYAHIAKTFANTGRFTMDLRVAPTVVGQSVIAWPVLRVFGFSHLALRLLTLVLSVGMLLEIHYILLVGEVRPGVRLLALITIVANPLFLHLSMSFMTENYGYFVALTSACLWFGSRKNDSVVMGLVAAAVAGFAFWIRQFSGLVFPAVLIAEWLSSGADVRNLRRILVRRAPAIVVWTVVIAAYFPWSKVTGNYVEQFAAPLARGLRPEPVAVFMETGIYAFYLTFFLAPLLILYGISKKPTLSSSTIFGLLGISATFAWVFGSRNGPSTSNLSATFPFLKNVFTSYGVGPLTLSDVYFQSTSVRPRTPHFVWVVVEMFCLIVAFGWGRFFAEVKRRKNDVGIFGLLFAVLVFAATVLSYRYVVFDRYHYPGVIGFAIALAVFLPPTRKAINAASIAWIVALGVFSTLAVHDYFRWQETRVALLSQAVGLGVPRSQIDAGYEQSGWTSAEEQGGSPECSYEPNWICGNRPYRIGLVQHTSDRLILSLPVKAWLGPFPRLKLMQSTDSSSERFNEMPARGGNHKE